MVWAAFDALVTLTAGQRQELPPWWVWAGLKEQEPQDVKESEEQSQEQKAMG